MTQRATPRWDLRRRSRRTSPSARVSGASLRTWSTISRLLSMPLSARLSIPVSESVPPLAHAVGTALHPNVIRSVFRSKYSVFPSCLRPSSWKSL